MLLRDLDPPDDADEPAVRRWPGALRLTFLLLAGAACWAVVILVGWFVWRRLTA